MTFHGGTAWIKHNALVWAQAGKGVHDHKRGAEGCEVCAPKVDLPHGRALGRDDQPGWEHHQCGSPACFCAAWAPDHEGPA